MDQELLCLLVEQARKATLVDGRRKPRVGDLVVEVTKLRIDPDAIGWLTSAGMAHYHEDNTGPKRYVWDVCPLSGRRGTNTLYQRWENAEFVTVTTRIKVTMPDEVAELIRLEIEQHGQEIQAETNCEKIL